MSTLNRSTHACVGVGRTDVAKITVIVKSTDLVDFDHLPSFRSKVRPRPSQIMTPSNKFHYPSTLSTLNRSTLACVGVGRINVAKIRAFAHWMVSSNYLHYSSTVSTLNRSTHAIIGVGRTDMAKIRFIAQSKDLCHFRPFAHC